MIDPDKIRNEIINIHLKSSSPCIYTECTQLLRIYLSNSSKKSLFGSMVFKAYLRHSLSDKKVGDKLNKNIIFITDKGIFLGRFFMINKNFTLISESDRMYTIGKSFSDYNDMWRVWIDLNLYPGLNTEYVRKSRKSNK